MLLVEAKARQELELIRFFKVILVSRGIQLVDTVEYDKSQLEDCLGQVYNSQI